MIQNLVIASRRIVIFVRHFKFNKDKDTIQSRPTILSKYVKSDVV